MARPTYGQPHGVRLNPQQDARCRSAIRTTELLKRLNGFALEEHDPQTGKPIQMSGDQIKAALGLLRKTMADLAVTQHVGPDGGPVLIVTGVERGSSPDPNRDDEADPPRGFTD
jgi:hypothetical protein